MANDWTPLVIPLGFGEDNSADELSQRPPTLAEAENWYLARDGALTPRPGFRESTGRFWTNTRMGSPGQGGAYVGGANLDECPFTPRELVKVRSGGGEHPLLLTNGRAYATSPDDPDADWHDVGGFWSAQMKSLGFAKPADDVGNTNLYGGSAAVENGLRTFYLTGDFTVHASDGSKITEFSPVTAPVGVVSGCALDTQPCMLYSTSGNALILLRASATDPHVFTETTLAADASGAGGERTSSAVWDAASARLYVLYQTTTATTVRILAVNTSGTVTHTVTYVHGTNVGSSFINLCSGRLVIALTEDAAGGNVLSKVYTAATPPVDQAIDVTHAANAATGSIMVGPGSSGRAIIMYTDADNFLYTEDRSTTSAAGTLSTALLGSVGSSSLPAVEYDCRWAPFRVDGRSVAGITHRDVNRTWGLVDVTDLENTSNRWYSLVAAGRTGTSSQSAPQNVDPRGLGQPLFVSAEFTAYDNGTGSEGAHEVLRLDLTRQIPVAEAAGGWILGGSQTYWYDGAEVSDLGFFGTPVHQGSNTAGGTVAAGDYAVCVVWTWTDALGRKHRSVPSAITTETVAGGATATVTVNAATYQVGQREGVKIELYMSAVNPPAGGQFPMYLQATADNTPLSGAVALTRSTPVSTVSEILYVDGGILENYPPPGSDGGVTSAGGRAWTASGRRLAASKLLERGPPAFNETLELVLPATGGDIVALAAEGDAVVVFCERAIYAVQSPGFDDLLQGQGFQDPVFLSDIGCSGARAVCRTPKGLVFQGADGALYASPGSPQRISRPVDTDTAVFAPTGVTLVHYPAIDAVAVLQDDPSGVGTSNGVLLWHYRNGQWIRWHLEDAADSQLAKSGDLVGGQLWTGLNSAGVPLRAGKWDLDAVEDDIGGVTGQDITCRLVTPWVRLDDDRSLGWARLGYVRPFGTVLATGNVSVTVHRDHQGGIGGELHTVPAALLGAETTWPTSRFAPEIRTARQKCSSVRLTVVSSRVILNEIELGVRRAGGRAPAGQRVQ